MKKKKELVFYSPTEEKINIFSHALGFILSIAALFFLLLLPQGETSIVYFISVSIFGVSLLLLYAASTVYHRSTDPNLRSRLRILDHAAIYVLIAGTYTPFTLLSLEGTTGWIIFGLVWGMALMGIVLKLFFTGRFNILSTLLYVGMGWLIIFAINPLMENLTTKGLYWLFAGGACYTIGAIIYSIKKISFNHAIFHIFVLLGSFCHFIAIYFYILKSA